MGLTIRLLLNREKLQVRYPDFDFKYWEDIQPKINAFVLGYRKLILIQFINLCFIVK